MSMEMETGPIGFLIAHVCVHVVFYLLPNTVWNVLCFVWRQLESLVIEIIRNTLPHVHTKTENGDDSTKHEDTSRKTVETLREECKRDKRRVCILASVNDDCHHDSSDINGKEDEKEEDYVIYHSFKKRVNNNKNCSKCHLSTYEMFGINKEWVINVNDMHLDSSEKSQEKDSKANVDNQNENVSNNRTCNENYNKSENVRHENNVETYTKENMESQTPYLHYLNPLYNAHIHTIFGAMRPSRLVSIERQTIASYDGGLMCLDWVINKPLTPKSKNALVFIVPGLTGSSSENYVQRMAYFLIQGNRRKFSDAFNKHTEAGNNHENNDNDDDDDDEDINVSSVFYTARGLGDTPLTTPQLFSANFTDDVRYVMHHVFTPSFLYEKLHLQESKSSTIPIIGIGFSMGGTVLSHYVSEESIRDRVACLGDDAHECDIMSLPDKEVHSPIAPLPSKFDAAISICSPYDAFVTHNQLMTPFVKHTYNKYLASNLRAFFDRHAPVAHKLHNVDCKRIFAAHSENDVNDDKSANGKMDEKEELNKLCEEVEHTTLTSTNGKSENKNGTSTEKNKSVKETNKTENRKEPLMSTLKTIWDFDNTITAPHFKYKDAEDYYTKANVFRKVVYCDVPQISLVARDDCVIGYAADSLNIWTNVIRTRDKFNKIANVDSKCTNNHSLVYVEMPSGGHLGFLQSPLREYHGTPNDMEIFVSNSVYAFIHNWYRNYT